MRFSMGLAIAAVAPIWVPIFVLAAACKKTDAVPAATTGSAAGSGSAGSAATAPASASAPAAWRVPTGARAADSNADATALGASVRVHLVERTRKVADNGAREVKLLLVLEGTGAIIADVTDEGLAQDGAAQVKDLPSDTDLPLAPLAPPRRFAASDAARPLEFAGPLLFLVHLASPGEKRDVAIGQDQDAIAVWTMIAAHDAVDVAPAWERTGSIKLAPGAALTAAAVPASAPPAPASAAAPAGKVVAAPSLDDALAAKGVAAGRVAQRASGPRSQWAAVKGKLDPTTAMATAFEIWRATAAGVGTLTLVPPASPAGSWFDELTAIEIKDVDGDGADDAVVTAKWSRQLTGKSSRGKLTTTEHVDAIYVIGGATLAVGAQHATRYATETNLGETENAQPEESIAFTCAVVPGPPPALHVEAGASTVAPSRIKGLLDPARDPWLVAGDLPIAFRATPP